MFDRHARVALIVVCVGMIVCATGFRAVVGKLNIVLRKQSVELREHFATLPTELGAWRAVSQDKTLGEAMVESLGTESYLNRVYERQVDGKPLRVELHLAYYTGVIDAVPHVPDRCFVASGGLVIDEPSSNHALPVDTSLWQPNPAVVSRSGEPYPEVAYSREITNEPVVVHLPLGEYEIRTSSYVIKERPDERVWAGYFFIANGGLTPSPAGVKKLAFLPTEKYAYYCKVQFSTRTKASATREQFLATVADLAQPLMPRLMRCLPDWPEVERRTLESTGPAVLQDAEKAHNDNADKGGGHS